MLIPSLLFLSSPPSLSLSPRPIKNPQRRTSDFLYICQTSWYLILREWELFGGRLVGMKDERSVLFGRSGGGGHREFDVAFFFCFLSFSKACSLARSPPFFPSLSTQRRRRRAALALGIGGNPSS